MRFGQETLDHRGRHRVVVTGYGAITPLGDVDQTIAALIAGKSGITRITRFETESVPVAIGGQIDQVPWEDYVSRKDARRMPLVSLYAVIAAQRACNHANLNSVYIDKLGTRAATVIGTTMGPHLLAESMTSEYRRNGQQRPNPVDFANCLPNMPAHYVSRILKTHGQLHTPVAACATGTQALGLAAELIRHNTADVVVAGATEAIIQDYIYAGFASMRALAEGYENDPAAASRPFDANRSGFVLSEGAGVLVMESLDHAKNRGASIHAELIGHANTSDAYHIAAIEPNARGMQSAMKLALADAGIHAGKLDYINAHGTGTEPNDRLETLALKRVLGVHANTTHISSTKGGLGHMMAATGAVEAIAAIHTLKTNIIPPTLNLEVPDPACDLNYTPQQAVVAQRPMRHVMSNNFGLGGQNASVILRELTL